MVLSDKPKNLKTYKVTLKELDNRTIQNAEAYNYIADKLLSLRSIATQEQCVELTCTSFEASNTVLCTGNHQVKLTGNKQNNE